MTASDLLEAIFALSPDVRYVALARDGELTLRERAGLVGASAPESDRYEELLVNPTLLTLVGQRGRIDCGGLEYAVIRYGNPWPSPRPSSGFWRGSDREVRCMLLLEEREDIKPECPHCGIVLDRLFYHRIRQMITARRVYFCPECHKVLGVSHDGNPWLGI